MLKTQPELQAHPVLCVKSVRSVHILMDVLWGLLMAYKANVLATLNHFDHFGENIVQCLLYCQQSDMKIDTTEHCLFTV